MATDRMTESSAQTALPPDHPLMVAWKAYTATADYANTLRWAQTPALRFDSERVNGCYVLDHPHTEGSLWGAFMAGYKAAVNARVTDAVVTSSQVQ